jgi:hypothetical protein
MKWISCIAALLLFSNVTVAQSGEDLLATPRIPNFFDNPQPTDQQRLVPGSVVLTGREIDSLILAKSGQSLTFPSIDAFTGNEDTPLEFKRVKLFAESSQIWLVGEQSVVLPTPGRRHFYIATNETTGIGLAVDPVSGRVTGFVNKLGEKLQISGEFISRLDFLPIQDADPDSNFCGTEMKDQSIEVLQELSRPSYPSSSAAQAGETINYQAVVAVETDSEWLDGFGDDTNAAMDWITDVFLAMNVFYERDVEMRLLIGDVILHTGSDPYSVPSDRFAQLNEFGAYWMSQMGHIDREFAAMFSGRNISGGSFSGIAWVNQYCDYGHSANGGSATAGSYSYNAIGSSRTPGNTALFVGHELGHNMGSSHTHCYNPPVDNCYNGESGCYSGTPQCPASGKGTVMSYCHVGGPSGAGCGSNQEFHPTVQALLEGRLATEMADGCIAPYSDANPQPEFDSTPAAGATLNFGDQLIGIESDASSIRVSNLGDLALTLSCSLSGPNAAEFNLVACPTPIVAAGSEDILISCEPVSTGVKLASLTVTTNDSDEGLVNFNLGCTGVEPPPDDVIFSNGFE